MKSVGKLAIEPLIAASLLYVIIGPYFVWFIISNKPMYLLVCSVVSFLFIKNTEIDKHRRLFFYLVFVLILYGFLTGLNIIGIIALGFSIFLPFGTGHFSSKVYDYLLNIYSFLIVISSVVWIFVLIGALEPMGTLQPTNILKTYDYSVYPFVVRSNNESYFRFCGLFDEPGVVGTFNALFLFIQDFNKKDWKTYALLFSGALSLSLFFYISIVCYYMIKSFLKFDVKVLLICLLGTLMFYNCTKDDEFFSTMLWERVEWDEDKGNIVGNNRVHDDANELFEKKRFTRDYWFGTSNIKDLDYFEGGSSYKTVVLSCGMICFSLYVLFFVLFAYKNMNKGRLLIFLFLLLVTFYQRPWVFGMGYLFLFPYYARCDKILRLNKLT